MTARAWDGLAASSKASMMTLNRLPAASASASRIAGARSSGSPGSARRGGAGDLLGDLERGLALGVHRAAHRPQDWPARPRHRAAAQRGARCGWPVGGGDDPAEDRGLADARGAGDHQHPPVRLGPVEPGHDPAQCGGAAAEPPAALAVDAHPARPRPPVPGPLGVTVQRPAPLAQAPPRRPPQPTSSPASASSSGRCWWAWSSVTARPSPLACAWPTSPTTAW